MPRAKHVADKASEIIAKLDGPKPIQPAEYLEDSFPAEDDLGAASEAIAAMIGEEPSTKIPCAHCAGTGMVEPALAEPGEPAWDETADHALDAAPINSKIVVVLLDGKSHAVLATPDGAKELPAGDPAHRLPEGARIRKLGEREYEAEQVSPVEDHAPISRKSTMRAIADFIPHFHPAGSAS